MRPQPVRTGGQSGRASGEPSGDGGLCARRDRIGNVVNEAQGNFVTVGKFVMIEYETHFLKFVADCTPVSRFYANKSFKLTANPLSTLELAVPAACKTFSSYSPL